MTPDRLRNKESERIMPFIPELGGFFNVVGSFKRGFVKHGYKDKEYHNVCPALEVINQDARIPRALHQLFGNGRLSLNDTKWYKGDGAWEFMESAMPFMPARRPIIDTIRRYKNMGEGARAFNWHKRNSDSISLLKNYDALVCFPSFPAGVVQGLANIRLHPDNRSGKSYLSITMQSTDISLLKTMQCGFGGSLNKETPRGTVFVMRGKEYISNVDSWLWELGHGDSVKMLTSLLPHMNIRKEEFACFLASVI